ncbi:MAG: InlB B-repeat-containing protein [Eubacteriales bacterium]|nr:InlB B-repeat-containing protein [Eubacteriales bacterium]
MKKNLLVMVICVCMLITTIPLGAFAINTTANTIQDEISENYDKENCPDETVTYDSVGNTTVSNANIESDDNIKPDEDVDTSNTSMSDEVTSPVDVVTNIVEPPVSHTHCLCGNDTCIETGHDDSLEWIAWDGISEITEAGNYYLEADVTKNSTNSISVNSNICLNGHKIQGRDCTPIVIEEGSTVNICDCIGGGVITRSDGSTSCEVYGTLSVYNITFQNSHQGPYVGQTGTLNIYNGYFENFTIVHGNLNMYDGTFGELARIYLYNNSCMNIYGGEVSSTIYSEEGSPNLNISNGKVKSIRVIDGTTPKIMITGGLVGYDYNNSAWTLPGVGFVENDDVDTKDAYPYKIAEIVEILLYPNGGEGSEIKQIIEKNVATAIKLNTFTRNYFDFVGWNTNTDGTGTNYADGEEVTIPNTGVLALYAKWRGIPCQVTFDVNGGDALTENTATVNYSSPYGQLPTPTLTGYSFTGWYTEAIGGIEVNSDSTVALYEDHTLYARWIANNYIVTLDVNDGNESSTAFKNVTYDSAYGATGYMPIPNRIGYTFDGWYNAKTGGGKVEDSTIVKIANNHTIYAHWTVNQYTVTLDVNEGDAIEGNTLIATYGAAYGELPEPTRDGYNFRGWYTAKEYGFKIESTTVVKTPDNHTLYACWSKIPSGGGGGLTTCTVKFNTDGGSKIDNQNVNVGAIATEPETPTKDGFKFDGWYTDKTLNDKYDFTSKVTKSINIYAKWAEDKEQEPIADDDLTEDIPIKNEDSFTDVNEGDWFYDAVTTVVENGLMNGITSTTFEPMTDVTRGMFVAVLHRLDGDNNTTKDIPFVDVKPDSYYADAVAWANRCEIVKGMTETEFAPEEKITREQMATILYRYAQYKNKDVSVGENTNILSYKDFDKISEYAIPAIQWTTGSGILKGDSNGRFSPLANAKRAEMATVLAGMLSITK